MTKTIFTGDLDALRSYHEGHGVTIADLGALRRYCEERGITEIDFGGCAVTDSHGNKFETKNVFSIGR